jgi:hypothetical protein
VLRLSKIDAPVTQAEQFCPPANRRGGHNSASLWARVLVGSSELRTGHNLPISGVPRCIFVFQLASESEGCTRRRGLRLVLKYVRANEIRFGSASWRPPLPAHRERPSARPRPARRSAQVSHSRKDSGCALDCLNLCGVRQYRRRRACATGPPGLHGSRCPAAANRAGLAGLTGRTNPDQPMAKTELRAPHFDKGGPLV